MAIICPTVTALSVEEYKKQLDLDVSLSRRIHIDLMDGIFARTKSPNIEEIWWPSGMQIDLHLMYQQPDTILDTIIKLHPSLVIVHAEAEGDFARLSAKLKAAGIKVGLALLGPTQVTQVLSVLPALDHVLVFSGHLGHFGGQTDLNLLHKVKSLKANYPGIEIGWDGGINDQNTSQLIAGGVDVLNTGGFIQKSANPAHAYAILKVIAQQKKDE